MATKAAPLSALASDPETADRAQQALDRLLASLDARKKPMFDPTLLALAEGFLAPTQTGGFGESLGSAAGKLRSAQEKAIQLEQEDAKARFELEQRRADLARQRKLMEGYANIQAPPGAPAGAPGGPGGPKGVQLFPGVPLPDFKEFMRAREAEGIPPARALEEYRKLQQDALKITEGGTTNVATGEYFPVPSADVVNKQLYGYDGTYPVPKRVAIQLDQLASEGKWDEYGALAKRIVEGPGAAPPKPPAAPAGAPFPDLAVTPRPLPFDTRETPPAGPQRATSRNPEVQAILDKLQTGPQVVTPPPAPAETFAVSPQGEAPQGPLPPMPPPPEPITLPSRFPPSAPQAPALGAAPRPAAPPQAPTAPPRPVAPLRSQEALEAEKRRATILAEEEAKRESAARASIDEKGKQAGEAIRRATQILRIVEGPEADKMFGILNDPTWTSGVARLIETGIGAPNFTIGVREIQNVIRNMGLSREGIARYQVALGLLAQYQLEAARLQQGQGSVSDFERRLFASTAPSTEDTPASLKIKLNMLRERAQLDREVARLWNASQGRYRSEADFRESDEYQDAVAKYEDRLSNILEGSPTRPDRAPAARPSSGQTQTRREADALTGRN